MQTRSLASAEHRREAQLQIVDPTSFPGNISPGKTVVNQPRSLGSMSKGNVDKFFIEPMTGGQFPSLESARRAIVENKTRVYEGSRTKQDSCSREYASKGFRLPQGWSVDEIQRKNSNHIDKYYVEPITGRRFRSLVSVERYLEESRNRSDEQLMLLEYHRGHSIDFTLPDGWIIEEKLRKKSSHIDRFYIELETGKKFRSLASVERYLQSVENSTLNLDPMVHPEPLLLTMNGNDDTRFRDEVIDSNPPKKVKWVLTGPGGNMFNANEECLESLQNRIDVAYDSTINLHQKSTTLDETECDEVKKKTTRKRGDARRHNESRGLAFLRSSLSIASRGVSNLFNNKRLQTCKECVKAQMGFVF